MMSNSNPNSRSLNSNVRSSSSLLPPYTPQNPFRLDNVKNPWNPPGWKTVRSTTTAICGSEITDDILLECVSLFNNNFGVWSEVAEKLNQRARAGSPVRTTIKGLRRQCIPSEAACTLVRHHVDNKLVGYTFATRWAYRKMKGDVCWVTQLVVDRNFRGLGIATRLLNKLKSGNDALFGIVSSHPAALMALSKIASGNPISSVNLAFIRRHISNVLRESNVDYLRYAKPHGSLFLVPGSQDDSKDEDEGEDDGTISCVETDFFLEHDEALQALYYLESHKQIQWPFGDLLEGVEFVLLVENKDHVIAEKD